MLHYFAGQPVELHQYPVWPLDLDKEVPEYCNCPHVSGIHLVLGAEGRQPDLTELSHIHLCVKR